MNRQHWQNVLVAMIGVWLVASPWLLNHSSSDTVGRDIALENFIIVGIALFSIGFTAITNHRLWQEWLDVAASVVDRFTLGARRAGNADGGVECDNLWLCCHRHFRVGNFFRSIGARSR